jgi:hypothetical protein
VAGKALAGGDVDCARRLEALVRLEVLGVNRLPEPVHPDFGEHRRHPVGGAEAPALVRIAHQCGIGADGLTHGAYPMGLRAPAGLADLDPDPAPTAVDE